MDKTGQAWPALEADQPLGGEQRAIHGSQDGRGDDSGDDHNKVDGGR